MIDHLLKNGIIVTVNPDREVFFHGAVAVQGNKIVDVGPSEALEAKYADAAKVTDLDGKIVFPGFVNTHNHLFQTLLKGLGDDMVLKDWLETMTFPAATNLTREDCYLAVSYTHLDVYKRQILGTSDMHGNIWGYSYEDNKETNNNGMARLYTYIQQVRAENPNTVLIDAGDDIQGTIMTDDLYNKTPDEAHPVVTAMNYMGYDAMTVGNHEFNWGIPAMQKICLLYTSTDFVGWVSGRRPDPTGSAQTSF